MSPAPSSMSREEIRRCRTRKRVAVLGSTGSIGRSALDVISRLGHDFEVVAMSADSNINRLAAQVRRFRPRVITVGSERLIPEIKRFLPRGIRVLAGREGLNEMVSRDDIDITVMAISGTACIEPLVKAISSGKRIALANKEALVSAGPIIMDLASRKKTTIIPVDSEHSAIFQCIDRSGGENISKIYLTGSGGPLLDVPKKDFDRMSSERVLDHPKWKMGKKISVDSATMMNKGLEIIEAKWLFDMDEKDIEILVHPEAIIHSMIELIDGTFFAQMSLPDMRLPIQHAITYPSRLSMKVRDLDLAALKQLSFEKPNIKKFPCLRLARFAAKKDGTYPAVLNVANEEAVKKYLEGGIKFSRIPYIIEKVLLKHHGSDKKLSLSDIFDAQRWAREEVLRLCH